MSSSGNTAVYCYLTKQPLDPILKWDSFYKYYMNWLQTEYSEYANFFLHKTLCRDIMNLSIQIKCHCWHLNFGLLAFSEAEPPVILFVCFMFWVVFFISSKSQEERKKSCHQYYDWGVRLVPWPHSAKPVSWQEVLQSCGERGVLAAASPLIDRISL